MISPYGWEKMSRTGWLRRITSGTWSRWWSMISKTRVESPCRRRSRSSRSRNGNRRFSWWSQHRMGVTAWTSAKWWMKSPVVRSVSLTMEPLIIKHWILWFRSLSTEISGISWSIQEKLRSLFKTSRTNLWSSVWLIWIQRMQKRQAQVKTAKRMRKNWLYLSANRSKVTST